MLAVLLIFPFVFGATLLSTGNVSATVEITNDVDFYPIMNQSYRVSISYENSSSGLPLSPPFSFCEVNFNGSDINLSYNGSSEVYTDEFTFNASGDYGLSILCDVSATTGYDISADDFVNITIWPELLMQFVNQTQLGVTDYLVPGIDFLIGANVSNLSGVQNATLPPMYVAGASCSVDGVGALSDNGSLYLVNTSMPEPGAYEYNLSCFAGGEILNLTNQIVTVEPYHAEFVDSGIALGTTLGFANAIVMSAGNGETPLLVYSDFFSTKILNLTSGGVIFTNSSGNHYNGAIGLFDADNDNDTDLFYAGQSYSEAEIVENVGYSFSGLYSFSSLGFYSGARSSIFDQDQDGDIDLLISAKTSKPTIQFSSNGSGYSEATLFGSNWDSTQCYFDANQDTAYDLYYAGDNGSVFAGLYQNQNGAFILNQSLKGIVDGSCVYGFLTNDTAPDLLVYGTNSSGGMEALLYDNLSWEAPKDFSGVFRGLVESSAILADFDNDGLSDLTVCGLNASGGKETRIYHNQGNSSFEEQYPFNSSFQVSDCSLSAGDYDRDGDLDLALAGVGGGEPIVLFNNTFSQFKVNAAPTAPKTISVSYNASSRELKMNWSEASDGLTASHSISYNIEVEDALGALLISGKYPVSSHPVQGYLGNMQYRTNYTLKNVSPSNFIARVQSIDNGYQHSTWREGSYELSECVFPDGGTFAISAIDCVVSSNLTSNASVTITNNGSLTFAQSLSVGGAMSINVTNGTLSMQSLNGSNNSVTIGGSGDLIIQSGSSVHNLTITLRANLTLSDVNFEGVILVADGSSIQLEDAVGVQLQTNLGSVIDLRTVVFNVTNQTGGALSATLSNGTTLNQTQLMEFQRVNDSGAIVPTHSINITHPSYYQQSDTFSGFMGVRNISLNRTPIPDSTGFDVGTNFTQLLTNVSVTDYANFGALGDVVIGKSNVAKIAFVGTVNVTQVNLSRHVVLVRNSVFVNSTAEPRLSRSANITIYNVSYVKLPLVYTNGLLCSDCQNVSSNGSAVSFTVSGFSIFTTGANANLSEINQTRYIVNRSQPVSLVYINASNSSEFVGDGTCFLSSSNGDYSSEPLILNLSAGFEMDLNLTTQGAVNLSVQCNGSAIYEPLNTSTEVTVYDEQVQFYLTGNLTGVFDSSIGVYANGSYFYSGKHINGTLHSSSQGMVPARFPSFAIADLDHDGIEDLVSHGLTEDEATLTYRLGGSQLETQLNQLYRGDLKVFDFDRDGDMDIVACGKSNLNESETLIFQNTLAESGFKSLGFNPISHDLSNVSECLLEVADMDLDGWLDVVLFGEGPSGSYEGAWYRNSQGVFVLNQTLQGLKSVDGVLWDYDSDGDEDLVVSGVNASPSYQSLVYENSNGLLALNQALSGQLMAKFSPIITKGKIGSQTQLIISSSFGDDQTQSVIFNGTGFQNTTATQLTAPAQQGDAIIIDVDGDYQPEFIITGKTDAGAIAHVYQSTAALTDKLNTPPNSPNITASYDTQLHLNFTNATQVIFRVGHDNNENAYISGARGSPLITTRTNVSIDIPKHCFVIQAQAVDEAGVRSSWSGNLELNKRAEVKNNNIDEDCDGVAQTQSSGRTQSSVSNSVAFTEQVVSDVETVEEPDVSGAPPLEQRSDKEPENRSTQQKEFEQRFEITHLNGRTKVLEQIKNIERTPKTDIVLRKTFPKSVLKGASMLNTPNSIVIIEEDPVLDFYLKDLEYLEEATIVYTIPGRRTLNDIQEIGSVFTAQKKFSKQQIEQLEADKQEIAEEALQVNFTETQTENGTVYTITLDLEENVTQVGHVEVEQEIPKCILEEINEQILEKIIDPEFINSVEIKEADPIIVWNLRKVDRLEELNLRLDSFREEDCEDEFKVRVLANSLINSNTKVNGYDLFKSYLLIGGVFMALLTALFLALREEKFHGKPRIHRLVKLILKRRHRGETDKQIKRNLFHNEEPTKDVAEAFAHLGDNPNRHKEHQFFRHAGEIIIFVLLLIISFAELFFGVAGEWDLIKKIISFVLMLYILYRANPVEMVFGTKSRGVSITLLAGMFIMHLKNLVPFADAALAESGGFVRSFYLHIIQNELLINVWVFWIGIAMVLIASLYAAFRLPLRDGGIGYVLSEKQQLTHGWHKLRRALWVFSLYMVFFVTVFNRFMEWLAIAIDAVVYVLVALFFLIHLMEVLNRKHSHHGFHKVMNIIMHQWVVISAGLVIGVLFLREFFGWSVWVLLIPFGLLIGSGIFSLLRHKGHKLQDVEQISGLSDTFYLRCAKLFKHPVTLPLGFIMLFVMQMAVEIALYIVSNLTGHVSHLYQGRSEQTLFSLFSDSGIISQHLIELSGWPKISMGLYYLMSIGGYLLLFLIPLFLFAIYFTNRKWHISRLDLAGAVFHNHGWIQGLGRILIICGVPLMVASLSSGMFHIESIIQGETITSAQNAGVSIAVYQIGHSVGFAYWVIGLSAFYMLVLSLVLGHGQWRDKLLFANIWGGVVTLIAVYWVPYYASVWSVLSDQGVGLMEVFTTSPLFGVVNLTQFILNAADFGVVYVLGASAFVILLIPRGLRAGIIQAVLRILPKNLSETFRTDLHYLHYYQDAKEHDSGNIVHHLKHFVEHERKAGYSDKELKAYILSHLYPKAIVEKVFRSR